MTDPHMFDREAAGTGPADSTQSAGPSSTDSSEEATCIGPDCVLPEVTFSTFVLSLASSALVQLGEVPDPETGHVVFDLRMAKHSIDILTMLQKKTRECLDSDEARLLEGLLYELRVKYVMKKR